MIDVAIIIRSTRPVRTGEAVAGNHLGTLPSDPTKSSREDHSQLSSRGSAPTTHDCRVRPLNHIGGLHGRSMGAALCGSATLSTRRRRHRVRRGGPAQPHGPGPHGQCSLREPGRLTREIPGSLRRHVAEWMHTPSTQRSVHLANVAVPAKYPFGRAVLRPRSDCAAAPCQPTQAHIEDVQLDALG
jgi:hypothetical protein